ncbi:rod shape-determining protein MreC [Verticiella sediminum]|uniref:Cell shape-determining protein MreC n=1 Tax=Verticiella sediminum TaxID=1247510 RepID=A0A556B2J1_9BURK|nr:rod shape-determining protein MreC [Verticiella sediminum]TSH99025.1 rod shape-determining protein MreC [Verticiella sediminum]
MLGSAPSLFRHGPPAWVRLSIFLLLAVSMMVVDARWRVLDVARQYIGVAVYPFQYVMLLPRDAARQLTDWLDTAERIRAEDEAQRQRRIEVAQLATYAAQLLEENAQLRRLLGAAQQAPADPAVLVELLYESRTQVEQRLIINKGEFAGIKAGNPLIDQNGVVGQVVRAGSVTSEVALLTDRVVSVPVQVLRNGVRAIAFPAATPGKLELRYVPVDADILVDDLLVTSGLGGWFPAGLPVARVEEVAHDPVTGYARVVAQPVAGLDRYRHFLVLRTSGTDLQSIEPSAAPPAEEAAESSQGAPAAMPSRAKPEVAG